MLEDKKMAKRSYQKPQVEMIDFGNNDFLTSSAEQPFDDPNHGHGHGHAWGYNNGNHYGHGKGHNPHDP